MGIYADSDEDLERANCEQSGQLGHFMCGVCTRCGMPRFVCGHIKISLHILQGKA